MIDKRKVFLKDYGFNSISEFARAVGEDPVNTHKIICGKQKPDVPKLLKYASVLNCSVDQIMYLFYPKEMREYVRCHNNVAI